MNPAMTGALLGFAVGFIGFVMLRIVANRIEKVGATAEPAKTASVMRMVALADWLIFTVIGFVVGPMVLSGQN
jgi:predicted PurR-regulated permease PerM